MDDMMRVESRPAADDVEVFASYVPVPPDRILPVNAYLLRAEQPLLVDTGLIGLRQQFMEALGSAIDPKDIRWIYLTHLDPDHIGSLTGVLGQAPNARVITTFLGMGKMGLHQLPVDRVYLLNPGQTLDVGDRQLLALKPPTYDAPETTGFFDRKSSTLFSADSFGGMVKRPAARAEDIAPEDLGEGITVWTTVDSPWLHAVDRDTFASGLDSIRHLKPQMILSSHLPPASGDMLDTLLGHLEAALTSRPFEGPDQAALERMLAGGAD